MSGLGQADSHKLAGIEPAQYTPHPFPPNPLLLCPKLMVDACGLCLLPQLSGGDGQTQVWWGCGWGHCWSCWVQGTGL